MKSQAYITQLFSLLLTGLLAGSMAFILPGQVTKITPAIQEKETENMAIILGNVLMSHPSLVYSEGDIYQRGVFDTEKLDHWLFKEGSGEALFSCGRFCTGFTFYPDSFGLMIVYDTENNYGWFSPLFTSSRLGDDARTRIESCFTDKIAINELFAEETDMHQLLKLEECNLKRHSTVLNRGFPVSVKYPDKTYAGLLKVLVVE